ncbi:MAG: O-acetyl-ADP-ribose deacetylase [Armatimonadetes bacterium CG2_30_66_41]|nr:MAG: O-acetyl-ADP-ribose deacetylase [Armatimonadetes bacterium CG2_30_66_41]
MEITFGSTKVQLVEGDLTRETTDAVVNAANKTLLGGGGVDGAIHRAGGPQILAECRKLGGCETGEAKLTTGGKLAARYVIHTVGPVYRDGQHGEPALLASCHQRSLDVALQHGLESVSFPAISTGVYGYPLDQAAEVALGAVHEFVIEHRQPKLVRFVLFSPAAFQAYSAALAQVAQRL